MQLYCIQAAILCLLLVWPHSIYGQSLLPPSLAAAQARAAATAAGSHRAGASDTAEWAVNSRRPDHSRNGGHHQLQQQRQQQLQQQQRRHLLAAKKEPEAAAAAAAAAPNPFANFTVGNVTAARENALKKALLENYEKAVFPWAEYGPADVKLNVALHKILSVDLYGGTLKLAVWMRQEWWDPRLTWDAKQWNVTKLWFTNPQQGDTEIWEPDIALWNAATPILYTLSQEPLAVSNLGRVYWTRPGVFEAACNFKGLSAYPFGRVRCQLELGSWTYGPWYVNVTLQGKGYAVGGSVTSGESAVWTEYKIQNVTASRHTYPPYPCCPDESDWPVMLVDLALERQNLIYMMKVIVPQIILTAVAFSTFWLSPACGERLGLAVTVPLAVAVYDLLTFSQLPVSNKVTLVSALGMTAFLFSMAVLLENAFVIQLWHYTEHTYFKGASVLAATAVAYREQLVWVQLLGCIHQLKVELARRQLAALQARKSSGHLSRSNSSIKDRSLHAPNTDSSKDTSMVSRWHQLMHSSTTHQQQLQQQQQQQKASSNAAAAACSPDTNLHGDVLKPSNDAAADKCDSTGGRGSSGPVGQGLDEPQRVSVLGRAKTRVLRQLGELEAQLGVQQEDGATDALLLSCTTKEHLRLHLDNILASTDKGLVDIQRRIQKAFLVFGEEVVCSRLHATLVGSAGGGAGSLPDTASDCGSEAAADVSPQDLRTRLAGEFNRRWQLLSMMIDHICRYLFISVYVLCMIILTVTLVVADE